jgi:hypothetical protein
MRLWSRYRGRHRPRRDAAARPCQRQSKRQRDATLAQDPRHRMGKAHGRIARAQANARPAQRQRPQGRTRAMAGTRHTADNIGAVTRSIGAGFQPSADLPTPLPTHFQRHYRPPFQPPFQPMPTPCTHTPHTPIGLEASRAPTQTVLPAFSSGAALRSATAAKRFAARSPNNRRRRSKNPAERDHHRKTKFAAASPNNHGNCTSDERHEQAGWVS